MTPEEPPTGPSQPSRNGWQWSVVRSRIDESYHLICVDVVNKAYVTKTWDDGIAALGPMSPSQFWNYMSAVVNGMSIDLDVRIGQR